MSLIALGVCGGIGAYKAVEIARGLQKHGHEVVAVMTRSATRFVGPLTFEAITRRPVITSQWAAGVNANIEHIALASTIDLLLVAPATANVVAKFATGLADDFLSTLYLATRAPVMMAPAMNTHMFEHPAIATHFDTLSARGVRFVQPGEGYLACGWVGRGRLAEPDEVVAAAQAWLTPTGPLTGRHIVITAGPTYEDIDPVRYLGNRSSGRMGYALGAEAMRRGALVTLVSGPTHLPPPPVATMVQVRTAAEMHAAVLSHITDARALIMAAAVADYTPVARQAEKMAKRDGALTITLTRTRDILADVGSRATREDGTRPLLVGFAADTHDVLAHAREKLQRKNDDLIVANDVSRRDAGFEVESNAVTLVSHQGAEELPLMPKSAVAARILDRVETLLNDPRHHPAVPEGVS